MASRQIVIYLSVISTVSSFQFLNWRLFKKDFKPKIETISNTDTISNAYNQLIQETHKISELEDLILLKRRQLECVAEVRVNPDLVLKIKRGQWKDKPDPLLKEWALCCMVKAGLMTKEGVYRMDVALAKVPDYNYRQVENEIDNCLSVKALPAVDTAYRFIRCYARTGTYRFASII